ncbi:hypothetical protein ACA910_006736 [Epithemia clementina (nom. ined.)]
MLSMVKWFSFLYLAVIEGPRTVDGFVVFVAPIGRGNRVAAGSQRRAACLFSTINNTTLTTSTPDTTDAKEAMTAISEDPYAVLFRADPSVDAPLPPAFTNCPFTGIVNGPQSFYRQASAALRSPPAFSFLHRNQPMVEVTGGRAVRQVLLKEFTSLTSNVVAGVSQVVCGLKSLRTAVDRDEHRILRQLVGVTLSSSAVTNSIPQLQDICQARIEKELAKAVTEHQNDTTSKPYPTLIAHDMTQGMALDVVRQMVLGLNLKNTHEISVFEENVDIWLNGMYHKLGTPEMEATLESRKYLVQAIEQKMDELATPGQSDGSTVGGLMFATFDDDDDDNDKDDSDISEERQERLQGRTLSREEVVNNALLLILAGTETTAFNTANSLLLMGLHPQVWETVVEEQKQTVAKHGPAITRDVLDDCPYLQAVIQEVLRILPVTLISRRVTDETIVIDATEGEKFQIPKGWAVGYNMYLTHQNDPTLEGSHMDLRNGFRPERWLDQNNKDAHDNNGAFYPKPTKDFIPFGYGPRKCPGGLLALAEMQVFLSLLARTMPRYELATKKEWDLDRPVEDQIEWRKISALLTPEDGVPIRILTS